ncbi:hypothetical protein BDZ91DRAFT_764130 [Kalaharituber pfeilii]|nr:hypothetical protein BDZ91DRAFT_764130 [Kalaharituber pfeilii]
MYEAQVKVSFKRTIWNGRESSSVFRPRTERDSLFAVKVYAGRMNALSGVDSKLQTKDTKAQDYLVASRQRRLDGFVANVTVKQFLAMQLGTGYSVESQITGNDVGGIQLISHPG